MQAKRAGIELFLFQRYFQTIAYLNQSLKKPLFFPFLETKLL